MKLHIVPARTGIQWVKLGIQTFFRQPLALAGLFFMYMAAMLLLSQVPFIGPVVAGMLVPAATLGLMAATAEATKGRFPMPSVLVSAFRAGRQRASAMLVLGAMYTAGSLAATAIGTLVFGAPATPAAGAEAAPPQLDARTLAVLVLHLPMALLFWHAPALVHWHGVSPVKSIFFSAVACLRNAGALLTFFGAWTLVLVAVGFVMSAVAALLGGPGVVAAVMMPAVLMMAAMFTTSMYFTFRDSFVAGGPDDPIPMTPPPGGESQP